MRVRILVASGVAAVAIVGSSGSASAVPPAPPPLEHCSVEVLTQKTDGELVLSTPRCFETQLEVRRDAEHQLLNVLAIHYKQTGYNGPSLTINGGSCIGGWANFQGDLASWRNAVVSTRNVFCPVTRHWSGFNKTGTVDFHGPNEVNLGSHIGNVSSASYHNS